MVIKYSPFLGLQNAMSFSALLAFMQHYVNVSNMLSLIQYRGFQVACPRSISNFRRMCTDERVCGVRLAVYMASCLAVNEHTIVRTNSNLQFPASSDLKRKGSFHGHTYAHAVIGTTSIFIGNIQQSNSTHLDFTLLQLPANPLNSCITTRGKSLAN